MSNIMETTPASQERQILGEARCSLSTGTLGSVASGMSVCPDSDVTANGVSGSNYPGQFSSETCADTDSILSHYHGVCGNQAVVASLQPALVARPVRKPRQHPADVFKTSTVLTATDLVVDATLPSGDGVMITRSGADAQKAICQWTSGMIVGQVVLETDTAKLNKVVALGHGLVAVGQDIFRVGEAQRVCTFPESINTDGRRSVMAISPWEIISVSFDEPACAWLDGRLSIRTYQVGDSNDVNLANTVILQINSDYGFATQYFYIKGYLMLMHCNRRPCLLIDIRSGNIVDELVIRHPTASESDQFGISFKCKLVASVDLVNIYFSRKQEPFQFMAALDVADGKFRFSPTEKMEARAKAVVIHKALRKRFANRWVYYNTYLCEPEILHVNSPNVERLGRFEAHEEEVLIHAPTGTRLPIQGSMMEKDIIIHSTVRSVNGDYMALVVSTNFDFGHVQLVVIDTRNGRTEHFYVQTESSCVVMGFTHGNREIVLKRTNRMNEPEVVYQPIFSAHLAAVSSKLYQLLFCQLPYEIAMNVGEFVLHNIRKNMVL